MICSLQEAVAELVHDGDTVALEGFTHLIPHAAGHEIIRQGRRDLHAGADDARHRLRPADRRRLRRRKLTFSWGGNPGVGSLHRFRDAVENGWPHPLEIEEHSHAGMASRYAAGAAGLPFGVLRGYVGTDLPQPHRHDQARSSARSPARCSPPCRRSTPTSPIIHAQRADRPGNVQIWGIVGVQKEAVLAATALDRHRRGGRRRARRPFRTRSCCRRGWSTRGVRRALAAPIRASRWATRSATTPSTRRGMRSPRTATRSPSGSTVTSSARRLRRVSALDRIGGGACLTAEFTTDEMMIVNAARQLGDWQPRHSRVCFVGIGLPSTAATSPVGCTTPHRCSSTSPGCIGSKPTRLPLSIGDGELAETADAVVSVPEIFAYWLQAGRIDVGFLGGAQLDRFANINSTVIGDYESADDATARCRRRSRDRRLGRRR